MATICGCEKTVAKKRFPALTVKDSVPSNQRRSAGNHCLDFRNTIKHLNVYVMVNPPEFPDKDYLLPLGNVRDLAKNNGPVIAGLILISGGSGRLFFVSTGINVLYIQHHLRLIVNRTASSKKHDEMERKFPSVFKAAGFILASTALLMKTGTVASTVPLTIAVASGFSPALLRYLYRICPVLTLPFGRVGVLESFNVNFDLLFHIDSGVGNISRPISCLYYTFTTGPVLSFYPIGSFTTISQIYQPFTRTGGQVHEILLLIIILIKSLSTVNQSAGSPAGGSLLLFYRD